MNERRKVLPSLYEAKEKGQLYFDDEKLIDVNFGFEQMHDGVLILKCTVPFEFAWSEKGTYAFQESGQRFGFVGLAGDNWSIKIDRLMIDQVQIGGISVVHFLCFEAELKFDEDQTRGADSQRFMMRIPLANCYFSVVPQANMNLKTVLR